jgi:uncharacterized protein with von Willebrand factor type A (vWA) domain
MNEPIVRFLRVARSAGIRVSVAESIDAFRALDLVGYEDRRAVKDTLGLVIAKTADEKQRFEDCFDLYFSRNAFSEMRDERRPENETQQRLEALAIEPGQGGAGAGSALARMLLAGDRAGLAAAMEAAGEAVGVTEISFFTQINLFARRMLEEMGLEALESEIDSLRAQATQGAMTRAQALMQGRDYLREAARDLVERQLALFAEGDNQAAREKYLQSVRLTNLDRRDLDRMKVIVRALARRLATRYGRNRKRKRRGHLDVRRTLRRNMAYGGVPFHTVWKSRKIEKPRVMVLCDVSGSVATVAQFLLFFLYSLNEALSDIKSFAFAGHLIEVSHILEEMTIEDAVAKIMNDIGYGSSNYGRSLEDFEAGWMDRVDGKTTVIVMGDARGNGTPPRTEILKRMSERAKRVVWLNPEYRTAWGTGDSDMFRYAPYCHLVTVCNTVRDLDRVLTEMLNENG